jgi:hypothetical protein
MWYSSLKKTYISRHILHQHWYSCPVALPVRQNPQHRSLLALVSATSAPTFRPLRHQRNVCHTAVNRFMRRTLTVNRKNLFLNILFVESFFTQKALNQTLLFGSTVLRRGRHFDYWNRPLNMRMRVYYLDSHDAGLCCYLANYIENLLHPLQLFYFHLWPIYWLSLVSGMSKSQNVSSYIAYPKCFLPTLSTIYFYSYVLNTEAVP